MDDPALRHLPSRVRDAPDPERVAAGPQGVLIRGGHEPMIPPDAWFMIMFVGLILLGGLVAGLAGVLATLDER